MIEIRSVSKSFGQFKALNEVSLALDGRKTHALLGSSGSGKSTLLRAILRLIPYDAGKILIDGIEIANLNAGERATRIGYVPQNAGLFPHLNVRDNITIVGSALKWPRGRITERLEQLRAIVPLQNSLLNRLPQEISGGQRQRVALLRSLFLDPDILLMDEPLAALDPLVRADIQIEMKALFSRLQKTVILVTHDVAEAKFLAENIVLMHEGRVVQKGPFSELNDHPSTAFVRKFINAREDLS